MEERVQIRLMDMFVAAWQDTEGLTVRQVSEKTNSEKKLCDIPSMDLLFSVHGFGEWTAEKDWQYFRTNIFIF